MILNDMREAGYNLTVNLYKAEQYGVPQTRHRVIIVGIRDDLPVEFHVPDPKQIPMRYYIADSIERNT